MKQKLTTLSIEVPYKRAGNVISQQAVLFDVYKEGDQYSMVPLLDGPGLAVANLPTSLRFVLQNGKPVSLRGIKDGNLHVIQDAVKLLQARQFLL